MGKAADVIRIARGEIGYREGHSGGHWNNHQRYSPAVPGLEWSQNQAWCATFVSWVAREAGVASLFPVTASVATAHNWFASRGRYSAYPAIGAQVIYGRSASSHTGICVAYDRDTITTVEGNTNANGSAEGNGVYLKKRRRRDPYVHGYGLPKYPEGVTTADPSLKRRAGFKYKAAASGPTTSGSHSGGSNAKRVTVMAGQSLATIAASAGVSLAAVIAANPQVKDPDVIHPGQRITVPEKGGTPHAKPTPKPSHPGTSAGGFPGRGCFGSGKSNRYVTQLGQALVRHGFGRYYAVGPGPTWTNADRRAVAAFQRAQGWRGAEADGYPGPDTWAHLMAAPKATPFPGACLFGPGESNRYVTMLGQALVHHGYGAYYSVGPGPRWTDSDRRATQAFQRAQGWRGAEADGIPGPDTWARLMR
ncbi:peptidoglycan-binding protein [Streptomyces qinglanensis]|uniref:peptidoglycan-binding protein n=1 Tax=Streptomyces qinglanensis TaxID=943816 RepID=UPI003D714555